MGNAHSRKKRDHVNNNDVAEVDVAAAVRVRGFDDAWKQAIESADIFSKIHPAAFNNRLATPQLGIFNNTLGKSLQS